MNRLAEYLRPMGRCETLGLGDLPGSGLPGPGMNTGESGGLSEFGEGLVNRLGQGDPAILIGWSMGGMAAMEAAAAVPEKVHALILLGATPRFSGSEDGFPGVTAASIRSVAVGLQTNPEHVLGDFFLRCAWPYQPAAAEVAAKVKLALNQGLRGLRAGLAYLMKADLRSRLSSITAPCLVIHGSDDRVTPMDAARMLAAVLMQAEVAWVPAAGHDLPGAWPEETAALIRGFLTSTPTGAEIPDSRVIAARFGASAGTYDSRPGVQEVAAGELMRRVSALCTDASHILEIGCGTGLLTSMLVERFPLSEIDAVDIADAMIESARARASENPRVRWHACDIRHGSFSRRFSLIISSSSLHWIQPLAPVTDSISACLEPGGVLACALMVAGTLRELHDLRRRVAPSKPAGFLLPCPEDVLGAVEKARLKVMEADTREFKEEHESGRHLLRALNHRGVTAGHSLPGTALNRRELAALASEYDRDFPSAGGGVFATYRVMYFTARKEG